MAEEAAATARVARILKETMLSECGLAGMYRLTFEGKIVGGEKEGEGGRFERQDEVLYTLSPFLS
jgi:hypothetical protein